ncbi:MAG: VirB3 family type IV secretion system protein [Steroidobacteraceae bacterium]
MSERNSGLTADPLFVGITRPPMRWGVAYEALLVNLVVTMEVFVITKNLLTLLIAIPIHGICALLCAQDARVFHLMLLWARTRLPGFFATARLWCAGSYSPLVLDLPNVRGRRRADVAVRADQGLAGVLRCPR